ncbi:hypothetical protein F4774DRAFT_409168 [Daldinia eschscholtzii]|nr:hypothetical protein F4774DRAFT_409168 [Daldinia eschscholtzii]
MPAISSAMTSTEIPEAGVSARVDARLLQPSPWKRCSKAEDRVREKSRPKCKGAGVRKPAAVSTAALAATIREGVAVAAATGAGQMRITTADNLLLISGLPQKYASRTGSNISGERCRIAAVPHNFSAAPSKNSEAPWHALEERWHSQLQQLAVRGARILQVSRTSIGNGGIPSCRNSNIVPNSSRKVSVAVAFPMPGKARIALQHVELVANGSKPSSIGWEYRIERVAASSRNPCEILSAGKQDCCSRGTEIPGPVCRMRRAVKGDSIVRIWELTGCCSRHGLLLRGYGKAIEIGYLAWYVGIGKRIECDRILNPSSTAADIRRIARAVYSI